MPMVQLEHRRREPDATDQAMTGDDLIEHRLKQLEDIAAGTRSTERDVDLLKVQATRLESLIVEIRTEVRERDTHTRASLARLHSRFDDLAADEHREQGAAAARASIWRTVAATIASVTAIAGVVVGVMAVIL